MQLFHFSEDGDIRQFAYLVDKDGVWDFRNTQQPAAIALTLRDSLVSRFDRIGPLKPLLQLAATIGRQFEVGLLSACAGRPRSSVEQALAALGEAGLIVPAPLSKAGTFMFRHALIRDTAYECMLVSQRRLMHREVAQALLRNYPDQLVAEPASVAQHWADAGEHAQAVPHAVQQLRISRQVPHRKRSPGHAAGTGTRQAGRGRAAE